MFPSLERIVMIQVDVSSLALQQIYPVAMGQETQW